MRSNSAALFLLLCWPAGAQTAPAAPAASTAPTVPTYVGSQTCQPCHEDIYNAIQKSPHGQVDTQKHRWEHEACESCHGPGSKHADSAEASAIVNPAKLTAARTDRICLNCHLNQPTHIGRPESVHARNQVACTACHSVHGHGPNGLVPRKAAAVNELCAGCHTAVWAEFQRPFKHRLPEGAMSCVDCHNPHGSIFQANFQSYAANEPACFKCHGNLRGPFTYEHAPVRLEGCGACHEPHGSANPRMLARAEVRYLCLECHTNRPAAPGPIKNPPALGGVPPAFHNLLSPQFRNCTVCHLKVHGSYVSQELLK
ncbi:MAG TPA: DmsE family decaheme c-type cytochrome [Bryobacteraceae bacterium]|nr:DmsE family decaheme c-type cytochrome [Bryobacteraceae bacterium]